MGALKCLTLIRITGKPLQKKCKCLHPVSEPQRQHGIMGFVMQGGDSI